VRVLDKLAPIVGPVRGQAVIAALDGECVHVFPLRGRPFDLAELLRRIKPLPFAPLPIFPADDGSVRRTAHIMTVNTCPYHCYYCSESAAVAGRPIPLHP